MIANTDIDIDVADRTKLLNLIKHTPAMINDNGRRKKLKLDVLNVSLYKDVESYEQLDELLEMEPMWDLLEHAEVVEKLFHIHAHYNIVSKMKPTTIEQLAAVLAIIRPAKRSLLGKDWNTVFSTVWEKPTDGTYYFKKAHAISYAMAIVLQLNMLVKGSS